MKNAFISSFLILLALIFTSFKEVENIYVIDATASELKWTGYHLAKSYEHTGFVKLKAGQLSVIDGAIAAGEFTIDMNSLVNSDVADADKNQKLVGHLKSPDFFDVPNNPEAKLVITKSTPSGNGKFKTEGNLTIRGITNPVEFETTLKVNGNEIVAVADLKIVRTDYKVMYGWTLENAMLSNEFRIEVKVIAKSKTKI